MGISIYFISKLHSLNINYLQTTLPVGQMILHIFSAYIFFFNVDRKCSLLIALKVIDDVIRQTAVTEAWQVPAEMPPVLRGERVQ